MYFSGSVIQGGDPHRIELVGDQAGCIAAASDHCGLPARVGTQSSRPGPRAALRPALTTASFGLPTGNTAWAEAGKGVYEGIPVTHFRAVRRSTGQAWGMDSEWPHAGTLTIEWNVSIIEGKPRLGWTYGAMPSLDPRHAITLLRDVADELEDDLPERYVMR